MGQHAQRGSNAALDARERLPELGKSLAPRIADRARASPSRIEVTEPEHVSDVSAVVLPQTAEVRSVEDEDHVGGANHLGSHELRAVIGMIDPASRSSRHRLVRRRTIGPDEAGRVHLDRTAPTCVPYPLRERAPADVAGAQEQHTGRRDLLEASQRASIPGGMQRPVDRRASEIPHAA